MDGKKKLLFCNLILAVFCCLCLYVIQFSIYLRQSAVERQSRPSDLFREMKVSPNCLKKIDILSKKKRLEKSALITANMLEHNYELNDFKNQELLFSVLKMKLWEKTPYYKELKSSYKAIFEDLKNFPIPDNGTENSKVAFDNSWKSERTYGGKRFHEGTDIMAKKNVRGYYPVVSITDGVVTKKGWLDKGGYRIGITSPHGGYFYYAHLYKYEPKIKKGDTIKAGQLLGWMGDSGYGEEGTVGKFAVHLHLGIYLYEGKNEVSVNPYWILKSLENKKIQYSY